MDKSYSFFFTGLSGSGKTTITRALEKKLLAWGERIVVLDGDSLREGLNSDLGFTEADRFENIRRAAEVARLFQNAGFIVLNSFIAPKQMMRDLAREKAVPESFYEIYVKADVAVCEGRDPKGLYDQARNNHTSDFTGISADYEPPDNPGLVLDTENCTVDECVTKIINFIDENILSGGKNATN